MGLLNWSSLPLLVSSDHHNMLVIEGCQRSMSEQSFLLESFHRALAIFFMKCLPKECEGYVHLMSEHERLMDCNTYHTSNWWLTRGNSNAIKVFTEVDLYINVISCQTEYPKVPVEFNHLSVTKCLMLRLKLRRNSRHTLAAATSIRVLAFPTLRSTMVLNHRHRHFRCKREHIGCGIWLCQIITLCPPASCWQPSLSAPFWSPSTAHSMCSTWLRNQASQTSHLHQGTRHREP